MNPYLVATVIQIIWATIPSASKIVLDVVDVETYIALRWTISSVLFGIVASLRQELVRPKLSDVAQVSALGIGGYAVASLGTLYGLKLGSVAYFSIVSLVGPMLNSAMAIVILREALTKQTIIATLLALCGVALAAVAKSNEGAGTNAYLSAALIVGACFLEGLVPHSHGMPRFPCGLPSFTSERWPAFFVS